MSLKRRNIIACILLFMAAICWTFGQQMVQESSTGNAIASTYPQVYFGTEESFFHPTTMPATVPAGSLEQSSQHANQRPATGGSYEEVVPVNDPDRRNTGFLLSFAAVVLTCTAIFGFRQKAPILGPDGICMIGGASMFIYDALNNMDYILWISVLDRLAIGIKITAVFLILLAGRELLGWLLARFPMKWCLVHRLAQRCRCPQLSLLVSAGWITVAVLGFSYLLFTRSFRYVLFSMCCFAGGAIFGILQLWYYGADLSHFQKQLNHFQQGLPIAVKDGAFAQTESQLLDVQAQHEEAVRAAVTSERFKVELISNVSHDLRTPLTSILGYSELLQKETLSPEGREQLLRLHQKAGYMNDLVESLFELTKVSSGVSQSKKEEIDLVRLLEQTIGLFDDQLTGAGLVVRRSYASDSIPIITDGARMHQVFANLLGNAIKYALPGTRIYLEVKETENICMIRMMNTASYEMDFQPEEIMQRFVRGDKARSTKGSGLGLAIAQTYTASVGGTFRVTVDGDQFSAIVELPKI